MRRLSQNSSFSRVWGFIALLAALNSFFAFTTLRSQPSDIGETPTSIQELSSSIQGNRPSEVRAEIIRRLGRPTREVGSGLRIEQWETSEGVLTFHPMTGPVFFDPKTRKQFRLLKTSNPAGSNILANYEMTSQPYPANHGIRYWLGNIKIGPDSTYRFTDSGTNLDQRAPQSGNFFMLHPKGTFEIQYAASITSDTLLESVAEGETVAHLVFTSPDGKHQAKYSVACSEQERKLTFRADKALPFSMDASWKSFWR